MSVCSLFALKAVKREWVREVHAKVQGQCDIQYNTIIHALAKIIDKGALERFFRKEGKMSDNVAALSIDSRKLRLYCLRISDQILILGNGGAKLTRTYEEDTELSGYVMDLQKFDKVLIEAQKNGTVTIEKNIITDIQSATFNIWRAYDTEQVI